MTTRASLRVALAVLLTLLLWLGWRSVRPPERAGDVPYVSTRPPVVDRMLELAELEAGDLLFDLGSGDGRIVLRAAERFGARARGYELDPLLVAESRAAAVRAGLDDRATFVQGDLFDAPLSEATAVTLFLLPTVNLALRPALLAELAPGTPVVSHMWDMAEWRPDVHEVVALEPAADVYLWTVPAAVGGDWELRLAAGELAAAELESVEAATDPIVVRLRQRFQEIQGDLRYRERAVPVSGSVRGTRVHAETNRPHAVLGSVALEARLVADRLEGSVTASQGGSWVIVDSTRRPVRVDGEWRVGAVASNFAPQWSMQWQRRGARWTATRWQADTDGPAAPGPRLLGAGAPQRNGGNGGERMSDLYVWGASIAFSLQAAEGTARRVFFEGFVDGDRIVGSAHDGGDLVPWVAYRSTDSR